MNKELHFKSEKQTWETPQDFFNKLDDLFGFTLDACASSDNAKVGNYYTVEQNALIKVWQDLIFKHADQVCFIKGRLKFGSSKDAAPFPSALIVFGGIRDLSAFGKSF